MANPAHVGKLREGVSAWNRWREQNWNLRPDLSGLDLASEKSFRRSGLWDSENACISLSGANLGWANLQAANLRGTRVSQANFVEANLQSVNLHGADLENANLSGANLSHADLAHANLTNALIEAADLSESHLANGTLINANLQSCNLTKANLRDAVLSGANLRESNLRDADLRSAQLSASDLSGADLSNADLWTANLSGAALTNAILEDTNLIRSDMHKADLSGAILYGADIRDANMLGVNMERAGVIGIKYERRFMRGKYQGIRGIESAYGDAIFRRDALDQDYIDTLASRWRRSPMVVVLWLWSLIDFGRSLIRTVWLSLLIIAGFGFVYMINPDLVTLTSGAETWFSPYYASFVTFTSLGLSNQVTSYGPTGEILLVLESALGFFMLGVLLAILMVKIARRS